MTILGFEYSKLTFFRQLSSKVVHLIGLDLDPRTTETLQVLCGVNTRLIERYAAMDAQDMAYIGGQHLTSNGWSVNSGRWPCVTDQEARKSLEQIRDLVLTLVEPWFQQFQTLSSVAEKMDTTHPRQGLDKARLFLADANLPRAIETLGEFLQRLDSPKSWDDLQELAGLREQAEALLREISV